MKSFQSLLTLFLSGILLLSACKKSTSTTGDALSKIPDNVSTVTAVDLPSLMKKADFDQVKTMEFYQEIIKQAKDYNLILGEIATDPEKSGINLDQKFYFVHDIDPQSVEEALMAAVFSMKDAGQFESLVKANLEGTIKEMGNYKIYQKGSQSIAWNEEIALIGHYNSYNDITTKIDKYFNGEASASIANNAGLQKVLSEGHDINSWMNSNVIAENDQLKMILPLINLEPEALKDNTVQSYVDFKNGEVEGKSILILNEGLAKDLDRLFKDKLETDFSSYIPGDNLNTLVTLGLDLKGLQEVISARPQGMMYVNFALKEFGLTFEDITNTFGGDLIFSVSGKEKKPNGIFATSIKDTDNLQKILDLAIEYEMLEKVSENHYAVKINGTYGLSPSFDIPNTSMHILIDDGILFASSDLETINTIENGGFEGSSKVDKNLIKDLSNNVFGLFMDYETLAKMMEEDNTDLENMKLTIKNRTSNFKLIMQDGNSNSLKQLFKMANKRYLKDKNKQGVSGSEI